MVSEVVVTHSVDDAEQAAAELSQKLSGFAFQKQTAGVLFCYSDIELDDILQCLDKKFDFDIVGCTCIGSLDGVEGFQECSAALLVLSDDNCRFSIAVSDEMRPDTVAKAVGDTYRRACGDLQAEPKLALALPPYSLDVTLDEFTIALEKAADGVPVVGGIPSNNGNGDINATFSKGLLYTNRMVLLLIGGDIKPVFAVETAVGSEIEIKRTVTSSKANKVYKVGDQTFTEYLRGIGFVPEELAAKNSTVTYVTNPLVLDVVEEGGEKFSFSRTLHQLDLQEQSGTAVGFIPEGARVTISSLVRDNISNAAKRAISNLSERMEKNRATGYRYTTVLAISCIGRYLVMLPRSGAEAEKLCAGLPDGLALCGFYSYGEIGPMMIQGEPTRIFAYNEALVLCAF